MMKTFKGILFGAALLGMTSLAQADNLKIGVVNFQEVLGKSPEAVQIRDRLQKEFNPREEEILKVEKAFRENSEKLQRDGAVMTEIERNKLERELGSNQRDLQRLQTAFREDVTLRQQEELQKYSITVQEAVEKLAKDQKYDILLQREVVPYLSEKLDITDKVIEQLKKSS